MSATTAKKPDQIRIRMDDDDVEVLDGLAGKALSRTDISSVLLHAAVEAIRNNKGKVHRWPPRFIVEQ